MNAKERLLLASTCERGGSSRVNVDGGIWALVPVKQLSSAKQRLSSAFSAEERVTLARAMVCDVLDALSCVRGLAGVAVVSDDAWAREQASSRGFLLVSDTAASGYRSCVEHGSQVLTATGARAVLTLPGDIPGVRPQEIEAILATCSTERGMTLVPSHDRRGTNALLLSPPMVVPVMFGEDSFLAHQACARTSNLVPRVLCLPGIALDIDYPADLTQFEGQPFAAGTRTLAWLRRRFACSVSGVVLHD